MQSFKLIFITIRQQKPSFKKTLRSVHQKTHLLKKSANRWAQRAKKTLAKGQSPPQELEESPQSGLYVLVIANDEGPTHG